MTRPAIDILREMIRIPSVNPMGRDVEGPEYLEAGMADYLVDLFQKAGIHHERIEVAPGRPNVIARIDRPDSDVTILLDAHLDTVPVEGMSVEPFEPLEKEGRIYGRGACDVKGPMSAMLSAFLRLAEEKPAKAANVVFSATCDEEAGQIGMADLVELWSNPNRQSDILTAPPTFAIVAEPTDLEIVVAHRGAVRWKLVTRGRAVHSSRPTEGINAIYRMAKIINCLEQYASELPQLIPPHPLCETATLSVGIIRGGSSINIVPDRCEIEIDRRTLPGETTEEVIQQLDAYCRKQVDFEIEHEPPVVGLPLSDAHNGLWADRLLKTIEQVAGPHKKVGALYGTHASRVDAVHVPTVVFGPGSITQAHTKDEWLPLDELELATEIYFQFCATNG